MRKLLPNSIFLTLLWHVVIATFVFIFIILSISYTQIDRTLIELRNKSLEQEAQDIASYIETTNEGTLFLDIPLQVRDFYAKSGKFRQYLVKDKENKIIFTSPVTFPELYPEEKTGNKVFEFIGPQGTSFLGVSKQYVFNDQSFIIQVAQSYEIAESLSDELTENYISRFIWLMIPFLILLFTVVYFSLLKCLKPLKRASQEAKSISFQNPQQRINQSDLPIELKSLAEAINQALEKLEQGIKTQQEFTANVAHELKTPLTIFKSRVQELGTSLYTKKLEEDIQEMLNAINQMLDLSKLDFPEAIEIKPINLTEVVKEACKDMWPLFIEEKRQINLKNLETDITVNGNRDLLYRAMINILQNVIIHTPQMGSVDVSLYKKDHAVELWFRDYGEAISDTDKEKIFKRFHRTDKDKFKMGAGIGLSIVSRTMDVHHGQVILDKPKEGRGNVFKMVFGEIYQIES